MQPTPYEIDEVGNAFVTIGSSEYTSPQTDFLLNFLQRYAQDLHESELTKIFHDKIEISDALKTLNVFANHYQNESEIIAEFQDEIEELIITINEIDDKISV
ncbi:hypothetical protein [Candidatus Berkiella aquae]|uniref:Uncharacterized protein n=1 Tax=Candidatus Berkiella aquae TaxID=295108 RepID=A0A0Q9YVB1_9GAMM|nr:hypothetical protein [Candidatus Berkiella aquae]MCS5710986.1 hypothetical protein [Candidatus Berkiella aquae]